MLNSWLDDDTDDDNKEGNDDYKQCKDGKLPKHLKGSQCTCPSMHSDHVKYSDLLPGHFFPAFILAVAFVRTHTKLGQTWSYARITENRSLSCYQATSAVLLPSTLNSINKVHKRSYINYNTPRASAFQASQSCATAKVLLHLYMFIVVTS